MLGTGPATAVKAHTELHRQPLAGRVKQRQGERALLLRALGVLKSDDVLVLDRGYPAWWLFAALHDRAVQFCMRLDGCGWAGAKHLQQSSQRELIVSHRLTA